MGSSGSPPKNSRQNSPDSAPFIQTHQWKERGREGEREEGRVEGGREEGRREEGGRREGVR